LQEYVDTKALASHSKLASNGPAAGDISANDLRDDELRLVCFQRAWLACYPVLELYP